MTKFNRCMQYIFACMAVMGFFFALWESTDDNWLAPLLISASVFLIGTAGAVYFHNPRQVRKQMLYYICLGIYKAHIHIARRRSHRVAEDLNVIIIGILDELAAGNHVACDASAWDKLSSTEQQYYINSITQLVDLELSLQSHTSRKLKKSYRWINEHNLPLDEYVQYYVENIARKD